MHSIFEFTHKQYGNRIRKHDTRAAAISCSSPTLCAIKLRYCKLAAAISEAEAVVTS